MKLPIITNAKRVLRSWEEGNPVDPEHSVSGEGDELDRHVIPGLLRTAGSYRRLRPNRDGKIEFDQQAASLLGQRLEIPPADAADKRFWQRLSITQASDIVEWRWGNSHKHPSKPLAWGCQRHFSPFLAACAAGPSR